MQDNQELGQGSNSSGSDGKDDQLARAREAARQSVARMREEMNTVKGDGEHDTANGQWHHDDADAGTSTGSRELPKLERSPSKSPDASRRPPTPPLGMPPRSAYPAITQCSPISDYERLNHIEEGSYGVVFRARHLPTGDIVAIKKLKLEKETNGFPITSLREIRTLMMARHENVVHVREVAVGDTLTQIFIVFEFVEHDLKTLLTTFESPFMLSEIKTLMQQLLRAVAMLHSQWIIHRDLKTSNLLLNNRGILKLADFGLARLYGDPPLQGERGRMTDLVVTLWYRAPELLLGAKQYNVAIDVWAVGCIMAELLLGEPLFPGKNENDQIVRIFKLLGQPTTTSWPELRNLPLYSRFCSKTIAQPYSLLRQKRFASQTTSTSSGLGLGGTPACLDLLHRLLTYDPSRRITAAEALEHDWFTCEEPRPAHPDTLGSWPSVAAGHAQAIAHRRRARAREEEEKETPDTPAKRRAVDGARSVGSEYSLDLGF